MKKFDIAGSFSVQMGEKCSKGVLCLDIGLFDIRGGGDITDADRISRGRERMLTVFPVDHVSCGEIKACTFQFR